MSIYSDALADLRRATNALALELPASVHEDYSRRLNAVLDLAQPADGITLTREQAEHAADWHDYIVDQGGEVPKAETELALRLRSAASA